MGNGVKQGRKLSLYLLKFLWTNAQTTGFSHGIAVVNHLIYTYDLLLVAPPKDCKHYLTYVTPTDVSTTFDIMLVNPWSCTLTLEMQILLGK